MATKEQEPKESVYKRFGDLKHEMDMLKPNRSKEVVTAVVAAEVEKPDAVTRVIRGFKWDGKYYNVGDIFPAQPEYLRARVVQLAKYGHITTEVLYQANTRHMQIKKTLEPAQAMMGVLNQDMRQRSEIIGQIGYHQMELNRLQGELEGVESTILAKEANLDAYLDKAAK